MPASRDCAGAPLSRGRIAQSGGEALEVRKQAAALQGAFGARAGLELNGGSDTKRSCVQQDAIVVA
jgi:hypothetical protein